jgi:hypothetical protein
MSIVTLDDNLLKLLTAVRPKGSLHQTAWFRNGEITIADQFIDFPVLMRVTIGQQIGYCKTSLADLLLKKSFTIQAKDGPVPSVVVQDMTNIHITEAEALLVELSSALHTPGGTVTFKGTSSSSLVVGSGEFERPGYWTEVAFAKRYLRPLYEAFEGTVRGELFVSISYNALRMAFSRPWRGEYWLAPVEL